MSYAPFIETIKIYKATTFSYQFNFNENDSPLDLTTLSDIEVTFSKPGQEIFKHTTDEGDLTISGTDDNELTGTADADTMDIGKRSYDLTITFVFPDGSRDVYVDFDAEIVEGENQTAHEWNIEIDTDAETTSGEQLTGLTSRALQAAGSLTKRGLLGYREYVGTLTYEGADALSEEFRTVNDFNDLTITFISNDVFDIDFGLTEEGHNYHVLATCRRETSENPFQSIDPRTDGKMRLEINPSLSAGSIFIHVMLND